MSIREKFEIKMKIFTPVLQALRHGFLEALKTIKFSESIFTNIKSYWTLTGPGTSNIFINIKNEVIQ